MKKILQNQKLLVNEIFCSRQGEGMHTGVLTTFIRLSGCNLSCVWCDTDHKRGILMDIDEIINAIKNYSAKEISITGGEPLFQKKCIELSNALVNLGYFVLLETNGTLSWKGISEKVCISMDIKTPSSNMANFNDYSLIKKLPKKAQVKFVIKDEEDYNFAISLIEKFELEKKANIILQPVGGIMAKKLWKMSQSENRVRLMLQIHKVVFGNKKGV